MTVTAPHDAPDDAPAPDEPLRLWTIGHSTHPLDEFLALLLGQQIECVVDVRRHPGSRAYPQFNVGPLAAALADAGIDYQPFTELGGRRKPRPDSTNTVWRNDSFRGYADYMETPAFHEALERLRALAARTRCAILCAEAVWWRCHRALIADTLKARGDDVRHIMPAGTVVEHPYTSAAQLIDGQLRYGPPST